MKKKILIFVLLAMLMVGQLLASDIYYYPDTKPKTKKGKTYSAREVRGKKIQKPIVYQDTITYAYVALGDITEIWCPYKITGVREGAGDLFKTYYPKDSKLLTIKAKKQRREGTIGSVVIFCEKGFVARIEAIIVGEKKIGEKSDATAKIVLIDGRDESNLKEYTKETFDNFRKKYEAKDEYNKEKLKEILYSETVFYPVGQIVKIRNEKIELKSLVKTKGKIFLNVEYSDKSNINMKEEDVFLYLIKSKKERPLATLADIIVYKDDGRQCATFEFNLTDEQKEYSKFRADFFITKEGFFSYDVDLNNVGIPEDFRWP